MSPHVRNVWSRLRNLLLHPPAGPELTAEGTARWATRAFASEWGGAELIALALADPCLKDAAQALRGEGGDAMEVDGTGNGGGGCCGGSGERDGHVEGGSGGGCCGGSGGGAAEGAAAAAAAAAVDVTRRGHAPRRRSRPDHRRDRAAGPEPAAAAMSSVSRRCWTRPGWDPPGRRRARPGAGPLGLVLATPAACGALDGALGGANALRTRRPWRSSGTWALGSSGSSRRRRLSGSRASALRVEEEKKPEPAAAAEKEEAEEEEEEEGSQDNGGILGVAGLRALLSFPAGTGLPGEDGARAALNALGTRPRARRLGGRRGPRPAHRPSRPSR